MVDSSDWDPDIVAAVRKYALQNAVEYAGQGQSGSVLGRLLSEREDLRGMAKQLRGLVETEVAVANSLAEKKGLEHVREELVRTAPEALEREKHRKAEGLKELPGDTSQVVLRFAPNPNGPLTLGHSRGVVINSEYARMYDGKVVLRFDDTDTRVKPALPDAYGWIEDEYEWLTGRSADVIVRASERMPLYLEYAERMIAEGFGYVCRCSAEKFRKFREDKRDCPCRSRSAAESLTDWKSMNGGQMQDGEAVVRIKTDMTLPNPALRDWPALRIQHAPHPLVGDQYKVWPLLDFQSAIEDHEQGVTHIVRGKDLMDSTRKQTLLYEHFGWEYPEPLYWGRVKIHEFGGFSTSKMRTSIESGDYEGWGDLRLPTLKSLRRRGFSAQALRDFWIDLGLSQKDISISMQTIEAFNSSIIDSSVERRSFVVSPVTLELQGAEEHRVLAPRHPDGVIPGSRELELTGSISIQASDLGSSRVRLKEFADIKVKGDVATVESFERSDERPIIHWVPTRIAREAELAAPAGDELITHTGIIEDFELIVGETYQLERVGFARLEELSKDGVAKLVWLHG
jgi:glutamyl-tRNA synthetase